MNHYFNLPLILSLTIFFGIFKTNNEHKQQLTSISAATQNVTGNKQQDKPRPVPNPFTDDSQIDKHDNHHGNEDGKFHQLCFDRIRRKENGFSICCAAAKLLVIILQMAVLVFSHYQVIHPVHQIHKSVVGTTQRVHKIDVHHATFHPLIQF
jgi:hypothetical protein